jgi:hypothetical protein
MNPFRSTRADNTISLTADSDHKWIQTASKVLFVPSCYDDIWVICVRRLAVFDGVVVSGTPGIGKSCFLDFALHNLLADNKSVMYVHGKSGSAYVYAADGSVESYSIAHLNNNDMAEDVDFVLVDPTRLRVAIPIFSARITCTPRNSSLPSPQIATTVEVYEKM